MQLSNITVLYAVEHIWFSCNKLHLKYLDSCNNNSLFVLVSPVYCRSSLQYSEHP